MFNIFALLLFYEFCIGGVDMPNVQRVEKMIVELGQFGKTESNGVTRITYSDEYADAVEYLKTKMGEIGLEIETDSVGNLFGTYKGKNSELPKILTGSHLDSVPEGGRIDGALGIACSLEIMHSWYDEGYIPDRDVKVIATIEEEGCTFGLGCMGARALAGEMVDVDPYSLSKKDGVTLGQCMKSYGLDPESAFKNCVLDPKKYKCYIELHAEQGEELVLTETPCAVVTNIPAIERRWLTFKGKSNHAGTTRMNRRKDAMVAASAFIKQLYEEAIKSNGEYVATVGVCNIPAEAINIVPGIVKIAMESRFPLPETKEVVYSTIDKIIKSVEEEYGITVICEKHLYSPPIAFEKDIIDNLMAAADKVGVKHYAMPSWAGHDGKIIQTVFPSGMLFVPSINGISHSPLEETPWDAVSETLKVLDRALKDLSKE